MVNTGSIFDVPGFGYILVLARVGRMNARRPGRKQWNCLFMDLEEQPSGTRSETWLMKAGRRIA